MFDLILKVLNIILLILQIKSLKDNNRAENAVVIILINLN